MGFLKNRTVLGVICIALTLVICFGVVPLFNSSVSQKEHIVRVTGGIKAGELITEETVQSVEVGSYNLPEGVARSLDTVLGRYATADLAAGDYILTTKLTESLAAENAYLYHLTGEQQAISVTIKSFAQGLSGKLISGDIVSVIAPDYEKQGITVIPPELRYVEVIGVTASTGYDTNTGEPSQDDKDEEEKALPSTVTLLVTEPQSRLLAALEAEGKLHLSLIYRGEKAEGQKFLDLQAEALGELYPPEESESAENMDTSSTGEVAPEAGQTETPAPDSQSGEPARGAE